MSKDEKKLKLKVDEYFEKYWSVSFEKFIENWEEMSGALEYKDKEIERLNKVLIYLEKYFSEREYYEFAQLVRETKKANIEWLEGAVKDYE